MPRQEFTDVQKEALVKAYNEGLTSTREKDWIQKLSNKLDIVPERIKVIIWFKRYLLQHGNYEQLQINLYVCATQD